MQAGFFEKQIVLTPDLCGSAAALSPLAAFTIFQGIASEHAERIGVGGAAMAKRGEFWLTVHSRVDFYEPAYLMDELTARTWPEQCEGRDIRCFRSYRLTKGEQTVALGRTQWAILGPEQKILRFEQSGFPADFPFPDAAAIAEPPVRFHDELTQDELIYTHLVRATDIDMGRHMNNVVYIRLLLDCLPAKELASGRIKSIEAHYASPCLEGETLGVFCRRKERLCRMAGRPADGPPPGPGQCRRPPRRSGADRIWISPYAKRAAPSGAARGVIWVRSGWLRPLRSRRTAGADGRGGF